MSVPLIIIFIIMNFVKFDADYPIQCGMTLSYGSFLYLMKRNRKIVT